MKVLFLDIDGVCNSEEAIRNGSVKLKGDKAGHIDAHMAFLVGKIQLDTGCVVVLSSSWRHSKSDMDFISERVVPLLDRTPFSGECDSGGVRGKEIKAWMDEWNKKTFSGALKEHGKLLHGSSIFNEEITAYAILDDDNDMLEEQMPHFFKTSWAKGLTPEIAEAVTNHLNGK